MDPYAANRADGPAQPTALRAQENAEHLSHLLARTAAALEQTARLADEHARRRESSGEAADAARERAAALRAREAARRAQAESVRWGKLAGGPSPQGEAPDR